MAKYLDQTGLTYFWGKIKGFVNSHNHPVGSVYITISSNFNPANHWGGTWSKIAEGQCLIQAGNTYTLGSTGGEASHTLTTDELPSHTHFTNDGWAGIAATRDGIGTYLTYAKKVGASYAKPYVDIHNSNMDSTFSSTGKNQAHNNMQPYIAVNIWKRTA